MQASQFLAISDYAASSNGWQDVIRTRFQPYVLTAGAVTAANAVLTAITSERNNIHTLLADGVVEVAPTIVAATADDGVKLRYIASELMTSTMAITSFGVGNTVDQSIVWYNAANNTNKVATINYRELFPLQNYLNNTTQLITTAAQRTTMFNLRSATIAACAALFDAVDTL